MEAIAWELSDKGVTYADIASVAVMEDISFVDAMLHIWISLCGAENEGEQHTL